MDRFGNDQDDEIVRLLGKLRDAGPEYPPRLFTARRAAILAALAALPIGGALAVGFFAKLANTVKAMSMIDKIILAVEATAIIGVSAYGVTEAYIYRHQLEALLFPGSAAVTPFPTLSVSSPVPGLPAFDLTGTPTPTPTGTLYYTVTVPSNVQPGNTSVAPTNPPVAHSTPTSPCGEGNCYGKVTRTPKPRTTREP